MFELLMLGTLFMIVFVAVIEQYIRENKTQKKNMQKRLSRYI